MPLKEKETDAKLSVLTFLHRCNHTTNTNFADYIKQALYVFIPNEPSSEIV